MIQDLLLSCLSLSRKGLSVRGFLASNSVEHFIHPSERVIFEDILRILNYFHEVSSFAELYGGADCRPTFFKPKEKEDSHGLYLTSFAKGVELAMEDYYNEIIDLESMCCDKSNHSLAHVYDALQEQLPTALFLRKLITEIKLKKLQGCALLQCLNQRAQHGDIRLEQIILKVIKPVKVAFLSNLSNWLLYGKTDANSEFFIKYTPSNDDGISHNSIKTGTNSSFSHTTKSSEDYIWQYEINMEQLPSMFSSIWAEKVLFVGQTVLVFQMDRQSMSTHKHSIWTIAPRPTTQEYISELWDGKESLFLQMIQDLDNNDQISVIRFENVVNEIKIYVSKRLSEIAINEVDLEHQMILMKDFYLLGRGEFYLELLRQEGKNKNYIKSFETAANVIGITEDLECFSLSLKKNVIDADESYEFGLLQHLQLKYIYKWPLNLLFSPKAISRYNSIFRFLLIVKKLQYDLHLVWNNHKWLAKSAQPINIKLMNLRNHLMFFLDNLQYYIQVDVLESQFSILMDIIRGKADFEEIQRAHTVFLANVLSQLFLLSEEHDFKSDTLQSFCQTQNPIYGTILEIFNICEKFSSTELTLVKADSAIKEIESQNEKFNVLMEGLIKLLVNIKTASSSGPLSQLLLRLDYNRWFSSARADKSL